MDNDMWLFDDDPEIASQEAYSAGMFHCASGYDNVADTIKIKEYRLAYQAGWDDALKL